MNEPTSPAMPRVLVAVATPEEANFLLPLAHQIKKCPFNSPLNPKQRQLL